DGTVLPQPLPAQQFYHEFGDAWRVTPATSLFDYAPGQSTATFTDPDFPTNELALTNLPANLVAQAAQLVAAAGITDPVTAANAELDYLVTGDPNVIVAAQNIQQLVGLTLPPNPVVTAGPVAPAIGVTADQLKMTEAVSGPTHVTFTAYLTAA